MTKISRAALVSALILFSACLAGAQESEPEVDCENAMAQIELNVCADREYVQADTELNAAYKQALAAVRSMDEEVKDLGEQYVGAADALKRAQRAWIGYRDGQCELEGFSARGGSMEPMLVSGCLASLTRKRTEELTAIYQSPEN